MRPLGSWELTAPPATETVSIARRRIAEEQARDARPRGMHTIRIETYLTVKK